MRSSHEHPQELEDNSYRELRLLEEVDSTSDLSQRQLARRLGIALGVANLLVRRLATKGYIKVTHLSWKRWVYVVTPRGMARKVQLTLGYIDRFMHHYRRVRQILRHDVSNLPLNAESRVAIVGTTELSELAFLALREIGVDDIDVFGTNSQGPNFLGIPVQEMGSIVAGDYAKIIVADSDHGDAAREVLYALGASESQLVEFLRNRG